MFAQLERDMAAARTRDGMAAAQAKGIRLSSPPVAWRIADGRWKATESAWSPRCEAVHWLAVHPEWQALGRHLLRQADVLLADAQRAAWHAAVRGR